MTSKMYDAILEALGTSRFVATGQVGGRCINEGEVDHGKGEGDVRRRVRKSEGHEINGDSEGPHSAHSVDDPVEYLDMRSLNRHTGMLGKQLAEFLHSLSRST
ncbi:uncharacterized protein [Palaemon carinicauda]|uniref:uncharacterized protein n=1 Tax=Palaemon carinicauda TaxID=392227 RepID=UPI0035B69A44